MPKLTVKAGRPAASLLARADAAPFQAKQAGRDRVVVHGEPELTTNGVPHPSSDSDLEAVIRRQLR